MSKALTPEQIAELCYSEHSPIVTMSLEDAKERIAHLIREYAIEYNNEKIIELTPNKNENNDKHIDPCCVSCSIGGHCVNANHHDV